MTQAAPERGQGGVSAVPPAARSGAPALAAQDAPAGASPNGQAAHG